MSGRHHGIAAGSVHALALSHRRNLRLHVATMIAVLAAGASLSCSKDSGRLPKASVPSINGVLNANGTTGGGAELPKYDPAAGRVSFVDPNNGTEVSHGDPYLGPASEGSTVKVPYISVRLKGATYFELMRCDYRYVLQIPTGENLNTLDANTPDYPSKARWAWQEALGDSRDCHIVGSAIAREQLPDITAPTGGFFYVVNPCVQQEMSSTGVGGCSYALATSNALNFKNEINARFLEIAQTLSTLEGNVTHLLFKLKVAASSFYHLRESCELIHADEQAHKGFFAAIIQLAVFVVAYAVATYFGGPAVGAMVANTALSITAMFLGAYGKGELKCRGADQELHTMENTSKEFQAAVKQVFAARKQMGEVEVRYKQINDQLVSDFINNVQANPHVVSGALANNPGAPQTLEAGFAQAAAGSQGAAPIVIPGLTPGTPGAPPAAPAGGAAAPPLQSPPVAK